MTLEEAAKKIFEKVSGSSFGKTDFALALMMASSNWKVPEYINEGLRWLKDQLVPAKLEPIVNDIDMSPEKFLGTMADTISPKASSKADAQGSEAAKK